MQFHLEMATLTQTTTEVVVDMPEEEQDSSMGMRLTFCNLEYVVNNKQNKKEKLKILHGLSGFFNPSQMTAVMGPR